ncbi:uncharacterized protein LOC125687893 isoform X2 [Lagopus muta]|uniref:uncharacterized protein LOC125687893 isoform X2 n=1 Tax=Lagopus muta TaxID=64668 RepID=UPI0020A023E0|nr:uncharacterized protein LOC125687893 isoform X2 [Lagopus muta]
MQQARSKFKVSWPSPESLFIPPCTAAPFPQAAESLAPIRVWFQSRARALLDEQNFKSDFNFNFYSFFPNRFLATPDLQDPCWEHPPSLLPEATFGCEERQHCGKPSGADVPSPSLRRKCPWGRPSGPGLDQSRESSGGVAALRVPRVAPSSPTQRTQRCSDPGAVPRGARPSPPAASRGSAACYSAVKYFLCFMASHKKKLIGGIDLN